MLYHIFDVGFVADDHEDWYFGLLRFGSLEPAPHLGPVNREAVGYLDWADTDDCIRYWVDKTAKRPGGKTCRKKPRKRATIRNVRGATASAEKPPRPRTKPPSPGGTPTE